MKKIILMMAFALLGIGQNMAQEADYTPFVREGVQWVCYFVHYWDNDYMGFKPGQTFFTLELKGDTVINGKEYKMMHKYSGIGINPDDDTVLACLREENRIVYAIIPEGMASNSFLVGYGELWDSVVGNSLYNMARSGQEIILYEFNETEAYYKYIYALERDNFNYLGIDKVDVGGQQVNRHTFNHYGFDFYIIEGIGYDGFDPGYPLSYGTDMYPYYLSHVVQDGKIIYKGANYMDVAPTDGRMPMVREGKQWVFERVTIDHGVTKSEYYTYEIGGRDARGDYSSENYHKKYRRARYCRYYEGMKPDGDGEIVCSLKQGTLEEMAFDNTVMDKVAGEGRNLIKRMFIDDDTTELLYYFNHKNPEWVLNEYILRQLSPKILTSDNFTLVEPVEIDGYSCNRYAYVDEDGEVQCYIIEGIGIDSRDMGDLLAPFTRKPDPEADYQEYCGLSHVIMDGKIIYKGMRYNAAIVEGNPYDVDGDGQVNIADVTTLIDMLLQPEMIMQNQHDIDGSGQVNIADVTALIDHILNH
jgi:hypothetical protein